jgi:hypothetical protein
MTAFIAPHLLHIMTISLQSSTQKGTQQNKIPVKQNKQTAHETAEHPAV